MTPKTALPQTGSQHLNIKPHREQLIGSDAKRVAETVTVMVVDVGFGVGTSTGGYWLGVGYIRPGHLIALALVLIMLSFISPRFDTSL